MLHDNMFDLLSVLVTASLAYLWMVLLLRVSGKRTLAQLNAFDFIVTVALGSILASVALNESVAWTEGALALSVFALLQFIVAWISTRSERARSALTSQPTVLLEDGEMIPSALLRERIDEDSVRAAVRGSGIGGLEQVAAVVIETDGSLSVISRSQRGSGNAINATN